jgi:hypothetical protein
MSRVVDRSAYQGWFKEFYGGQGTSLVNAKAPLASILMKNKNADWVGDQFIAPIRFGSAVGLGYRASGSNLPQPVASPRDRAAFRAGRAYGTVEYDRETIVSSRNDKGAFAKVTVSETEALVEGFQLHMVERALFGDSTGALAQIDDASITGAGTSGSPWAFDLDAATSVYPKGKAKYLPQNAKIDLYTTGGVYGMTIQIVSATTDSTTGVVSVTATTVSTGNAVSPVDNDVLYWEGSKDQEIVGLRSLAPVSAGTLYGISQTTQPKFRGLVKSVSGALQYDDINDQIEALSEESMAPNIGVTSHKGLSLLKNLSEDAKRYNIIDAKSSDAQIGFKGIEAMSSEGPFPIIASQMCPNDEIWLMNTKKMQLVMRQDFGFFDDDGTVLLRDPNKDVYAARYGGYFQLFCDAPNTIARIYGFSV